MAPDAKGVASSLQRASVVVHTPVAASKSCFTHFSVGVSSATHECAASWALCARRPSLAAARHLDDAKDLLDAFARALRTASFASAFHSAAAWATAPGEPGTCRRPEGPPELARASDSGESTPPHPLGPRGGVRGGVRRPERPEREDSGEPGHSADGELRGVDGALSSSFSAASRARCSSDTAGVGEGIRSWAAFPRRPLSTGFHQETSLFLAPRAHAFSRATTKSVSSSCQSGC